MWPQYINCSLFNMQGDILFCSERHFAVMLDFQAEVNAVRDGIERMYSGCNIDKKKIKGASFSVPARLISATISFATHLPPHRSGGRI
jgi:hypothetical protein